MSITAESIEAIVLEVYNDICKKQVSTTSFYPEWDSLDLVEFIMILEDKLLISIPDSYFDLFIQMTLKEISTKLYTEFDCVPTTPEFVEPIGNYLYSITEVWS